MTRSGSYRPTPSAPAALAALASLAGLTSALLVVPPASAGAAADPGPTFVLRAVLADGHVYDVDEYEPGDVALLAVDPAGASAPAGTEIEYAVFSGGTPTGWRTGVTGDDGRLVLSDDLVTAPGQWNLAYRLPDSSTQGSTFFHVGEATLQVVRVESADPAPSGGELAYQGRLATEGVGAPLAGRVLELDLRRGVENVPGTGADAALVTEDGTTTSQRVRTDENGLFAFRLQDPVERGRPAELGGRLRIATADNVPDAGSTLSGDADVRVTERIDFGSGKGAVTLGRSGAGNGARADRVTVTGPASVAGEKVRFVRVGAQGGRTELAVRRLDARGDRSMSFADRNGTRTTTYVVELLESRRVQPGETDPISLR